MSRAPRFLLFLAVLLAAAVAAEARGVTVYIQRVLVADAGDIRLGDLVQTAGDAPAAAREALATSVAALSDRLLYIPSRLYMDEAESAFGRDSIFVGSRSLVIPKGAVPDGQIPLLDRVVDFLMDSGVLGADETGIQVRSVSVNGTLPQGIAPSFKLVRSSSLGSVEVSFAAEQASGRVVLELTPDQRSTAQDVRPSDPVRVVFHKGVITIEMQGKAQAGAGLGDSVSVFVPDSQKSFTGRLRAGKAVDVDLP